MVLFLHYFDLLIVLFDELVKGATIVFNVLNVLAVLISFCNPVLGVRASVARDYGWHFIKSERQTRSGVQVDEEMDLKSPPFKAYQGCTSKWEHKKMKTLMF